MNGKILLLLFLGISILVLGCAGRARQDETQAPPTEPEEPEPNVSGEASEEDKALADLFKVDTDKPLADEGLDVQTPKSEE